MRGSFLASRDRVKGTRRNLAARADAGWETTVQRLPALSLAATQPGLTFAESPRSPARATARARTRRARCRRRASTRATGTAAAIASEHGATGSRRRAPAPRTASRDDDCAVDRHVAPLVDRLALLLGAEEHERRGLEDAERDERRRPATATTAANLITAGRRPGRPGAPWPASSGVSQPDSPANRQRTCTRLPSSNHSWRSTGRPSCCRYQRAASAAHDSGVPAAPSPPIDATWLA